MIVVHPFSIRGSRGFRKGGGADSEFRGANRLDSAPDYNDQ